jgi:cytochrome c-type biogenesis protein CcmF
MIPDIGLMATWLALLSSIGAVAAAWYGYWNKETRWIESARRAAIVVWPLLTLAVIVIEYALLTDDFSLQYVYGVSERAMPTGYKIAALWGGQDGSILFWSWLMASFIFVLMLRRWDQDRDLLPHVIVVTMGTLAFFIALNLWASNPFKKFDFTPADGHGLDPLLRHFAMVIHPPMLYLGFVGFVIPYAFAMAALITRRPDARWIHLTRRWALVAWLFLGLGLLLGARWAYDVLGWGGYWAWDAAENAALIPWLTGTAFLHSVQIQEKRGMLKIWNMALIILTYGLVIFGTFIIRSGVIDSVHAFARSAVGPAFFGFMAVTSVASVWMLLQRLDDLRSDNRLESLFSRESVFMLNNLLFLTLAFSVLVGTVFPMASELFTGEKISVGPPWFNRVTGPQFGLLVFLMGIAPLFAWRKQAVERLGRSLWWPFAISLGIEVALLVGGMRNPAALFAFWLVSLVGIITLWEYSRGVMARRRAHQEPWPVALWRLTGRNRRRYGGYMIHLGVVCMALGVLGTQLYKQETQGTLTPGESMELGGFQVTYNGLRNRPGVGDLLYTVEADLTLSRDGRVLRALQPRLELYSSRSRKIPAKRSTISEDFYIILADLPSSSDAVPFKVYINPLVNWLWLGGLVFTWGTLVAVWPDAEAGRRAVGRQVVSPTPARQRV